MKDLDPGQWTPLKAFLKSSGMKKDKMGFVRKIHAKKETYKAANSISMFVCLFNIY